jgi:hypothetical protein
MERTEHVFVTDNLKLAIALTAAGFAIRQGEQIDKNGKTVILCELDPHHNGVDALYLKECFEWDPETRRHKREIIQQIDEIIEARGITQEEYVLLAFDAARCALHNRSTVLYAIYQKRRLIQKDIGNGRSLIYREGTEKKALQKLVDNA